MIEFIYTNKNLQLILYGILFAVLGAIGISFHPLLAALVISFVLVYTYNQSLLEDENSAFIVIGYFIGVITYLIFMPSSFFFSFDNYLIRIFLQTLFVSILIEDKYSKEFKYTVGFCLSFTCPISIFTLITGLSLGIISITIFSLGIITYVLSFLFNYFCIIKKLPQ